MAPADAAVQIEVIYSPAPGEVRCQWLSLPAGACVRDAVQATGWFASAQDWEAAGLRAGIWGQLKDADAPLRDRDRVELYRPLQVDPKEARRLRHRRHKESVEARAASQRARRAAR